MVKKCFFLKERLDILIAKLFEIFSLTEEQERDGSEIERDGSEIEREGARDME